jgi:hypothetical protein
VKLSSTPGQRSGQRIAVSAICFGCSMSALSFTLIDCPLERRVVLVDLVGGRD